jgi:hypothetical protein
VARVAAALERLDEERRPAALELLRALEKVI